MAEVRLNGSRQPRQISIPAPTDAFKAESKRIARNKQRRERDEMLRDLGLTKVRGAVSGRTYWE